VLSYIKQADARAIAGMKAVSVLVAQKQIPSGTTAAAALRGGMLASETLPASSVPANALSTVPAALSSLVLSAALPAGQVLLRPMLVTPVQTTSGLAIPTGLMALAVDFCLPEVVAGAVQAGSEVAVFDTVGNGGQLAAVPGCTGAHDQVAGNNRTRVVLSRVEVLSVGTAPPPAQAGQTGTSPPATTAFGGGGSTSSSQSGTMVTLAVTQAQAERLIQLTETGMPYLALLSTSSRTVADIGNLLNYQPHAAPNPKPKPTHALPPLPLPTVTPSPSATP
jgi:pilus assembly protein CpaB